MATEVIMPKAGMAMEEGTIVKWFKKEGDKIEKGEVILEILTDKVNMEIEAEESGALLKILAGEGEVLPVLTPIAYIGKPGEKIEVPVANNTMKTEEKIAEQSAPASRTTTDDGYDVIVIGGGPAGYVAAIKASQLGGKVALVEKDVVGGTCLNRGCIPTKTYLKNAEMIDHINHAKARGIMLESTSFKVDMDAVVAMKNQVVNTLTTGVDGLLKSYGVKVYKGVGAITKDKKVKVGNSLLETKKIILAGGSKVAKINVPGMESKLVLTSDEILDLKEIPNHLTIIGGGVIGVEMAVVFNAYGSQVTIIEMADRIVPVMDKEVSLELEKALKKKGIKILTNAKLERIEEKAGKLALHLADGQEIDADKALLSIGRVPDLEGVGEVDLALERGRIKVNEYMETSVEGIYAPGDVNGRRMLAHAAFKMGEVAAANALGHKEKTNLDYVPSCIYTSPEVAAVGMTEEEARKRYDVSVGKFPFNGNGRALASGETVGFVKVVADKKYGEILGVHIIGPGASEMINEAAALMATEIPVDEAAQIIHGHPTFSEAFMEACADSLGICIHLPKK